MDNEIAIIGMAGRFPGAKNYKEFWKNLKEGKNSIRAIPNERWDQQSFYSPQVTTANTTVANSAGLLDDIKGFDHQFFGIPYEEAKCIDPQTRLFLEETWHCVEDAAISLKLLQKATTSVYFGVSAIDYFQHMAKAEKIEPFAVTGAYPCMGAHRVSHFFNFRGASFSIDAACAASFAALHEAKLSLQHGLCDFAIVGAANLINHPWHLISLSKCRVLSIDGQCKTFDKEASGYVRGEGIGVFLLTTKERALSECHRIHAIIKGSALQHSGKTRSISTPNPESQVNIIKQALEEANIQPRDIDYLEAHGTGTILGDAIEFNALNSIFQEPMPVGSVKANIGHLEAASGFASLFKVILMMKEEMIPMQINVNEFNPMLELEDSKLFVLLKNKVWKRKRDRFCSSITSMGFGGLNTHVIVEEVEPYICRNPKAIKKSKYPILLSARNDTSLKNLYDEWKAFVNSSEYKDLNVQDISYTLLKGRQHFEKRIGLIASSTDDLGLFKEQEKKDQNYDLVLNDFPLDFSWSFNFDILSDNEKISIEKLPTIKREDPRIINFLKSYSLGKLLLKFCGDPKTIAGIGIGQFSALVLSGGIEFENGINAILNDSKYFDGVKPRIPFYDNFTKSFLDSHGSDNLFCSQVRLELEEIMELEQPIAKKVNALLKSQFTLKKTLETMDKTLKFYGISALNAEPKNNKHYAMVNFTLFASLDSLFQKYHIKQKGISKFPIINMLRNFFINGDATYEEIIQVIASPLASVVILTKAAKRDLPWTYQIDIKGGYFDRESDYISIGYQGDIFDFESLSEVLVSLWLQGKDVAWDEFADTFYKQSMPVQLPNYKFESTPVWCN